MTSGHPDYRGMLVHVMYIDPVTGAEKAHPAEGLPYKETKVSDQLEDVADDVYDDVTWTADDWGEGLDFYVKRLTVRIHEGNQYMTKQNEGFLIRVVTDGGTEFLAESVDASERQPVFDSDDSYLLWITFPLEGKVLSTETLQVVFRNGTGVTLSDIYLAIGGIAI